LKSESLITRSPVHLITQSQPSLSGGVRHIRRIDFWYKTQPGLNGKASVTVLGMK
jgi:hypothetical protein